MKLKKCDLRAAYIAASIAETGEMSDRHGAVIYRGNKIISKGINKHKTHPLASRYYKYPYMHAEFDSIIKAKQSIQGCSLAVVRISNKGELLQSKPCLSCLEFMKKSGIKFITYSHDNKLIKIRTNKEIR
jgi:deoxycytidylate deaminase